MLQVLQPILGWPVPLGREPTRRTSPDHRDGSSSQLTHSLWKILGQPFHAGRCWLPPETINSSGPAARLIETGLWSFGIAM